MLSVDSSTEWTCHCFAEMPTFWVSDGLHSVHTITLSDMGAAVNSNNEDETQEKLIQITGFFNPLYSGVVFQIITVHALSFY